MAYGKTLTTDRTVFTGSGQNIRMW